MKFTVVDGGATTQFWEYGNHLEEIFSKKFFWTKLSGIEKCFVYKNYLYLNH
jgi:hypothetical protein